LEQDAKTFIGDTRKTSSIRVCLICESVRWIEQNERVVLLEPENGGYCGLNRTAFLIWEYCDGTKDRK